MKTKFEITMTIEIENVGDVPADSSAVSNSVVKAVENISSGDVVRVTDITTSVTPKVKRPFSNRACRRKLHDG